MLPATRTRPVERAPPFDHERLHGSLSGNGCRQGAAILATALEPTRAQAWETLTAYTKSEALLRHALAVEASTASYARRFGADEELWRVTALLHDFDYEIHPTLDKHPQDGAPILRELGYPEELVDAVLSHAEHLHIPRDTPLKKTLFACDELSGFVHACGLVRPTGLEGLEPKSVRKKLKQPSFAAGVHRDEVYAGAELLEHRARRAHRERRRGTPADRGRARPAHRRRRRLARSSTRSSSPKPPGRPKTGVRHRFNLCQLCARWWRGEPVGRRCR